MIAILGWNSLNTWKTNSLRLNFHHTPSLHANMDEYNWAGWNNITKWEEMLTCKQAVGTTSAPACIYQPSIPGGALLNSISICSTPRVQVQVQSQATVAPTGELPTQESQPRVNYSKYRWDQDKSNTRSIQMSSTRMSSCECVWMGGVWGGYCHITNTFAASLSLFLCLSVFLPLSLSLRL